MHGPKVLEAPNPLARIYISFHRVPCNEIELVMGRIGVMKETGMMAQASRMSPFSSM
jgi:hypothetical protein